MAEVLPYSLALLVATMAWLVSVRRDDALLVLLLIGWLAAQAVFNLADPGSDLDRDAGGIWWLVSVVVLVVLARRAVQSQRDRSANEQRGASAWLALAWAACLGLVALADSLNSAEEVAIALLGLATAAWLCWLVWAAGTWMFTRPRPSQDDVDQFLRDRGLGRNEE